MVPTLNPSFGGSFQYSLAMLDAVSATALRLPSWDFVAFVRSQDRRSLRSQAILEGLDLAVYGSLRDRLIARLKPLLGQGRIQRFLGEWRSRHALREVPDPARVPARRTVTPLSRSMRRHQIDWVLYTAPDESSFESGVPYVMPVFDLQHRLQPEFPEVSANGEWERREYLYRNGIREAVLILADSEVGKEDILHYYSDFGITSDRVQVLPYVPPPYISSTLERESSQGIRRRYDLPDRYFLYPAQFWPHKNHLRIVQAVAQLHRAGAEVEIVFCGTHAGELRTAVFREVMGEAHHLGVAKRIHYLGYVPNDVMSVLYTQAVALVMPTFFGPTNIPVMEAWTFGCPVITSDIRGIREQVADAGILVDPRSVEAIADAMGRLWEDEALGRSLAERGARRLAGYGPEQFRAGVADVIALASARVTCA